MTRLKSHTLARLRSQMSRAQLVLFIGAGFSSDAKDRFGKQIPDVRQLKQELWDLCFPSAEFDESTLLGDLFGAACRQEPRQLEVLLTNRLTVDPDSLPDYYQVILDLPWHCCYTLNVDDLILAATRRFGLRRTPAPISATYTNEAYRLGPS